MDGVSRLQVFVCTWQKRGVIDDSELLRVGEPGLKSREDGPYSVTTVGRTCCTAFPLAGACRLGWTGIGVLLPELLPELLPVLGVGLGVGLAGVGLLGIDPSALCMKVRYTEREFVTERFSFTSTCLFGAQTPVLTDWGFEESLRVRRAIRKGSCWWPIN